MSTAHSRVDPVLMCLLTLCGVAIAGYGLDRAAPAAQVVTCWFLCLVMHLMLAVVAFGARGVWPHRLATGGAAAGVLLATGDLAQLMSVLSDPAGPNAVVGGAAQVVTGTAGLVALVYAVPGRPRFGRPVLLAAAAAALMMLLRLPTLWSGHHPRPAESSLLMAAAVLSATLLAAAARWHQLDVRSSAPRVTVDAG